MTANAPTEHLDQRLDAYVDGELSEEERSIAELHLAECRRCRQDVHDTRQLLTRLRALPGEIAPDRDLWNGIERELTRPRSRISWTVAVSSAGLLAAAAMCAFLPFAWFVSTNPAEEAETLLARGDFYGAAQAYQASGDAAGIAYFALLAGEYDAADGQLATLPDGPQVRLRRAIIALRKHDLDAVAEHGVASGIPAGLVLAAEVRLADADPGAAVELLGRAAHDPGPVGETAREYLRLLNSTDAAEQSVAGLTALWALGERATAVRAAADVVPELLGATRDEELLVWAGRAATSREAEAATQLLDAIAIPPDGQAWRIHATRAHVLAVQGDTAAAASILDALEAGGAPDAGLADARATAAALAQTPGDARTLLLGVQSPAAARALLAAGGSATEAARISGTTGTMAAFLAGR